MLARYKYQSISVKTTFFSSDIVKSIENESISVELSSKATSLPFVHGSQELPITHDNHKILHFSQIDEIYHGDLFAKKKNNYSSTIN